MLETKPQHHDIMTRPVEPAPSTAKVADRFPPPLRELIRQYGGAAPPCELTAHMLRDLAPEVRRRVLDQLHRIFGNDYAARVIGCMDDHGQSTRHSPADTSRKNHRPMGAAAEKAVE